MANIFVYGPNILGEGTQVTATGVAVNSSASYLHDDRLSFKFVAAGSETTVLVNPPELRGWNQVVLVDHEGLAGGDYTVWGADDISRVSQLVLASGTIGSATPFAIDVTNEFSDSGDQSYRYIDVRLRGPIPGDPWTLGELVIAHKFASPQRPSIGIETRYLPRATFIELPNGERQTLKHAEVARVKRYTIPGMTLEDAHKWSDLFLENQGSGLVVLEDDEGNIWPALMGTDLTVNDESKIVSLALTFIEVSL